MRLVVAGLLMIAIVIASSDLDTPSSPDAPVKTTSLIFIKGPSSYKSSSSGIRHPRVRMLLIISRHRMSPRVSLGHKDDEFKEDNVSLDKKGDFSSENQFASDSRPNHFSFHDSHKGREHFYTRMRSDSLKFLDRHPPLYNPSDSISLKKVVNNPQEFAPAPKKFHHRLLNRRTAMIAMLVVGMLIGLCLIALMNRPRRSAAGEDDADVAQPDPKSYAPLLPSEITATA